MALQFHRFIASSAADAIAQVRQTLGADAVVVDVRRPEMNGLARLWQRPRIEVLAHVPEQEPASTQEDAFAELRRELRELRQKVELPPAQPRNTECHSVSQNGNLPGVSLPAEPPDSPARGKPLKRLESSSLDSTGLKPGADERRRSECELSNLTLPPLRECCGSESRAPALRADGGWRIQSLLEQTGLMPVHAHRVLEEVRQGHGAIAPRTIAQEIQWACEALRNHWPSPRRTGGSVHVFAGPPGSGKTTCLSKWLAQTVLVEERPAVVFRLDAHVANTSESLTVLCEILGVRVERFAPPAGWSPEGQTVFIDLPGVNPSDAGALASLDQQLSRLPAADVHLVLNAAYDSQVLLGQTRGFSRLPISDLIATHLDEESRWGRLWNLVLGSGYNLRFLSAGQNIPGEFVPASPDRILARQFPQNLGGFQPAEEYGTPWQLSCSSEPDVTKR